MKKRDQSTYARKPPSIEPYDVVLIVCEGEKTEPSYLKRLRALHRLTSANIDIVSPPVTDPVSLVLHAEKRARAAPFDRVFCVFDRDGHQNYDAALHKIASLSNELSIEAITSWPCFEMWCLLHYAYNSSPVESMTGVSACQKVIRKLKQYLSDYEKNIPNLYDILQPRQDEAVKHATRLLAENEQTGTENPHTKMHILVEYLTTIRGGGK